MNDSAHRDRVLALAAAFQALSLVQQVARTGRADPAAFSTSAWSILRLDTASTLAIYGGPEPLALGLEVLGRQLGDRKDRRDPELTRYWVSVMFLEHRLSKRPDTRAAIRRGVAALAAEQGEDRELRESTLAGLATLYQETLSTLSPRILVSGEPEHLGEESNATRIRVLLLSAIRATILWRGLGGSRLKLLLTRRRVVAAAEAIRGGDDRASQLPEP